MLERAIQPAPLFYVWAERQETIDNGGEPVIMERDHIKKQIKCLREENYGCTIWAEA